MCFWLKNGVMFLVCNFERSQSIHHTKHNKTYICKCVYVIGINRGTMDGILEDHYRRIEDDYKYINYHEIISRDARICNLAASAGMTQKYTYKRYSVGCILKGTHPLLCVSKLYSPSVIYI